MRRRSTTAGPLVGTELELTVGAVAAGGSCVAHAEDGRVVFVRHALPGERVRALVTDDRASFLRADAVQVHEASSDRVTPPCPYAGPGRCGGCDWQHARPEAQRALKEAVVREQLERLGGIPPEEQPDFSVAEVAPDLGWRTRVGFAVRPDGVVGLHRHRSDEVERVDACLIAHPRVTEVGVERALWPGTSAVEVVAATGSDDRAVIVTPAPGRKQISVPPLDAHVSLHSRDRRGRVTRVRGRSGVRERAAGRTWRVTGGGFWQVHPAAAQTLVDTVLELADPQPGESALDLYSGVGLLAGALADRVGETGQVLAVEGGRGAADDARHNLRDLPQARVEHGPVEAVLARRRLPTADVVVLDPPRAGAGRDVVTALAALAPRVVVYVACDPAALGRDLATFAGLGYRLDALRGLDLFPMTAHVECVAALVAPPSTR